MKFEVDTGCSVTVLSQVEYGKLEVKEQIPKLKPSHLNLKTYTGQSVNVLGTSKVQVKHNGLVKDLSVGVVAGSGPNMLGRSWIAELDLSWEKIKTSSEMLQDILKKHEIVFKEELGTLKGTTAKIHVVSGVKPHFF